LNLDLSVTIFDLTLKLPSETSEGSNRADALVQRCRSRQ
jgi:hypothetical protein